MSIKQEYEDYAARREALAKTHFGPIWLNPLDRYVHPFRTSTMTSTEQQLSHLQVLSTH